MKRRLPSFARRLIQTSSTILCLQPANSLTSSTTSLRVQLRALQATVTPKRTQQRQLSSSSLNGAVETYFDDLLQDPSLLLNWDPISSSSSDKANHETFDVTNPADPEMTLARVPSLNASDAIDRSSQALPSWKDETTAANRGSFLTAWSALVLAHQEDLAVIMTLESGKPLAESRGEVKYAASFLDYYAGEAIRPTGAGGGFVTPSPFADDGGSGRGSPRGQLLAIQQPVGVCAMITPWNFPAAMITRKVGPALAAGCTAVVKPSELTPLSAIALATLAQRAGIPEDVFQIVTASSSQAPAVGTAFSTHPTIRKLSFTGSTNIGKLLMQQSSQTVQRLSLELGGNAPFVVFDDVLEKDSSEKSSALDQAVNAAMASKFRNAGQTCVCSDRFLVQNGVHDAFVEALLSKAKTLKIGDGRKDGVNVGPLISEKAKLEVHRKVVAAIDQGAKCILGGRLLDDSHGVNFYPPTILTNVTPDMEIWNTETFGPVVCIHGFGNEEEALILANDSPVGLASYFCTTDLSRTFRFASKLETGLVGVNEGIISTASAPFGGVKESGLGREGSAMGLAEYLETKYIFINA